MPRRAVVIWSASILLFLGGYLFALLADGTIERNRIPQPAPYHKQYSFGTLSPEDKHVLIDLRDFQFKINSRRCDNSASVFLLVFVHSAPANIGRRQTIRQTWGNETNLPGELKVIFLVGSVNSSSLQKALEAENKFHNDLVQGNFLDTYRNLTYKHIMGLKWVTYYCRQAKYIFKSDDDIFVDIFQLAHFLRSQYGPGPSKNFISCFVIRNPHVKRTEASKWRVTYEEYPGHYYPPYCSGWGILMSPDVVYRLYRLSEDVPYFWVDDVLVTGVLASHLGLSHVDLTSRLDISPERVANWLAAASQNDSPVPPPLLFGLPNLSISDMYTLWNKTLKYYLWAQN